MVWTHYSQEVQEMLKTPELAMNSRRNLITVCNGRKMKWHSRQEAQAFFLEAMMSSDGEEHDRNECIYIQLLNGLSYCTDED